ncbi:MAG: hypothetical protein VKP63_11625 [Cyanobacteriota bacterium]|nr:hypothetical protein [Cyanobacteriota bacterium]
MATATKSALPLGLVLALGFAPPVLATPDLCVLAPLVSPIGTGARDLPLALVPLRRPTLFLRESLAELRLEEGDTLRWRASTRPDAPLEGPLAWPLDPLTPGQRLTLRLRPLGAGPNQFASLLLQAGPQERLTAGDNLLRSLLAGPPTAWRPAIEGLLAKGDRALATALLFASEGPSEPDLNALRLQAAHTSCP